MGGDVCTIVCNVFSPAGWEAGSHQGSQDAREVDPPMAVKKKASPAKKAPARKRSPSKGPREKAADKAVGALRDLGLVTPKDEALVSELTVVAKDLDVADRESFVYPQLVRIYHDLEQKLADRLLTGGDDDEGQSLADRLAALGDATQS